MTSTVSTWSCPPPRSKRALQDKSTPPGSEHLPVLPVFTRKLKDLTVQFAHTGGRWLHQTTASADAYSQEYYSTIMGPRWRGPMSSICKRSIRLRMAFPIPRGVQSVWLESMRLTLWRVSATECQHIRPEASLWFTSPPMSITSGFTPRPQGTRISRKNCQNISGERVLFNFLSTSLYRMRSSRRLLRFACRRMKAHGRKAGGSLLCAL